MSARGWARGARMVAMATTTALLVVGGLAEVVVAQRGPILKVAADDAPVGWDPHVDLDPISQGFWEQIYEGLVQVGPLLEVEPALAESWEQPDARTYVFHLRRKVLFQHGREMGADDVKYSIGRAKAEKPGGALSGVETVESIDKHTVKLVLTAPDAFFLWRLAANRGSAIVPREIVERHGSLKATMVGTGPFRIKKVLPGSYELERNPRYWARDLPRIDGLLFLVAKDEASRVDGLRRGTIDLGGVSDPRLAEQASHDKTLRVESPAPSRQIALWLQCERDPFKARKLRQALSAAVDRGGLIRTVLLGRGELTAAIPPALPAFAVTRDEVERLPFYRRDLASSRRLLADAGRPKGFEFTALVAGDAPELMATAQTVQSQLKEAGIAMTIRTADTPGLAARWRTGDFQALMTAGDWSADPAAHIGPLLSATPRDGRGHCRNPEGDRLFESARAATDPAARAQLLRRLQAVLAEDVPAVWLAARPARFEIMRAAVSGYRPGPDLSRVNLDHAAVEK